MVLEKTVCKKGLINIQQTLLNYILSITVSETGHPTPTNSQYSPLLIYN